MNHDTLKSIIVNSSSVTLENMKTELNNKIYAMIELAWEGIDPVEQIKEDLGMNKRPKTSLVFDPLQTIGK